MRVGLSVCAAEMGRQKSKSQSVIPGLEYLFMLALRYSQVAGSLQVRAGCLPRETIKR
jgi:hypothetical protein